MSETFEEWFEKKNWWSIEAMKKEFQAEYYCRTAWYHQQEKIDELEKKLAEAVELIDCTSDRWGKCKCKSCAFLDSLEEKEAQGEG